MPAGNLLDALVFSSPDARFKAVFVAGNPVPANALRGIEADFVEAMTALF